MDPFDQAYARVYGTPQASDTPAAPAAAATPAAPESGRTKTKADFATEAEQQQNPNEGTGIGDYAWDAGVGVMAGAEGFAKSVGKLTNDVADVFGMKFADDSTFDNKIKTKTWLGGLTSGMTQFALGFVPALGLAGRVGAAVGVGSKLVQGLAAGAAADFVGFSEKQEKLSNLVQQFPSLRNPVTDYLSSKPDDNWAEGRLKNALEGMGLSAALEPFMHALRGFKSQALAKALGNKEAFAKAGAETEAALAETINKNTVAAGVGQTAAAAADGTGKLTGTAGKMANEYLRNGVPDDLVNKIVDHIKTSDEPFEVALDNAVKTHVNYDRLVTSADVDGLQKLSQKIADSYVQKSVGGVQKLAVAEKTAEEVADTFGENPKLFVAALAADEKAVGGMAERLVSYRIMRNTLGQSIVNASNRWLAAAGGEGASSELERISTLTKAYLDTHRSVQVIQTEGARIPSFGRIAAGTTDEFDPAALAKMVEKTMAGGNGAKAAEQLARTIVATDGDPKSLLSLFDNVVSNNGRMAASVLNELHTNAILSGLTTPATKVMSDIFNAVWLPAERIVGGAWQGNAAAMKSGFRMYSNLVSSFFDFTNLSSAASKISDQYGSSLGKAWDAFLGEKPLMDHMTDFNPNHAITGKNFGLEDGSMAASAFNYLGQAVRLPQRLLMGMDEMFKNVNYRAYVRDEATRLAEQSGITNGEDLARFVDNHIAEAFTPEGLAKNKDAFAYAKSATFQSDLIQGTIGSGVQDFMNEHPMLRLIVPFVKTPTNIFRRAVQMTPGLNLVQTEFRKMALSADPMERAVASGRTALGGMFWTTAIGLASGGKLTGGGPSNPEEKNAKLASGWQPYSVELTGEDGKKSYVSYKKLEPFAYLLGLAADWSDAAGQAQDADSDKVGTAMVYALAKNLSSKTYLTGLSDLVNALSRPEDKIQSFINSFAGSFVPTALAKANSDDYMHEVRGMMDAIMRRVPGLSEDLPPNRNLFGEPIEVPKGYLPFGAEGGSLARQVSPVAFSKQVDDPVKQALADLQYPFKKAPRSFQGMDLTAFHNEKGQDAYDRLQELHGTTQIGGKTMAQSLADLVGSQRYAAMRLPDRHGDESNPRVQAVNQLISAYRERALGQTLREYPAVGNALRMYQQQARGAAPSNPSPVLSALQVR